jgi:hypothetical protein
MRPSRPHEPRLTTFQVWGCDRQQGAIGISTDFQLTIEALTAEEAREVARDARYQAKREHVLIYHIEKVA